MTQQIPDSAAAGIGRTGTLRAPGPTLLVVALALGLVAGIIVGVAGNLASRSSIGGPGWSLSGNGALSVIAAGAVAAFAGGWAMVAARVGWQRRVTVSMCAWLTSLVVVVAREFGFLLPEPYATLGGETALPAVLAALVGLVLPRVAGTEEPVPRLALIAVGLLLVIALVLPGVVWAGFYWIVTPLLIDVPLLARAGRQIGWSGLLAACLAVMVGVVVGGFAGLGGA